MVIPVELKIINIQDNLPRGKRIQQDYIDLKPFLELDKTEACIHKILTLKLVSFAGLKSNSLP